MLTLPIAPDGARVVSVCVRRPPTHPCRVRRRRPARGGTLESSRVLPHGASFAEQRGQPWTPTSSRDKVEETSCGFAPDSLASNSAAVTSLLVTNLPLGK
jgi:hypothetical protein